MLLNSQNLSNGQMFGVNDKKGTFNRHCFGVKGPKDHMHWK
jgi:hypothetical protein